MIFWKHIVSLTWSLPTTKRHLAWKTDKKFTILFNIFQKLMPVPSSPLNQPKSREKPPQPWKMSCLRPAPPSRMACPSPNDAGSKRNSISSKSNLIKKGKLFMKSFYHSIWRIFAFSFCRARNILRRRHANSSCDWGLLQPHFSL